MIKNSVLYYGMPLTGKSTLLLRNYIHDYHQYHVNDLCINLWTFLHHDNKHAKRATLGFISSPNGRMRALRIPYNPNGWLGAVSAYHAANPHIKRAMIDECQCVSPVYLVTLCMIIRDFYPKVPIIFTCIDYDSWHHKLPQINALIKMVPESHHLHHRCMLCHRIATRRLHVVNHRPEYNEKRYGKILRDHAYKPDGRPNMYSVCSRHYRHLPNDFERRLKKTLQPPKSKVQRIKQIRKHLGLNPNVKIRVAHQAPSKNTKKSAKQDSGPSSARPKGSAQKAARKKTTKKTTAKKSK